MKTDKDGQFFSFHQSENNFPSRERSNSQPKINGLKVEFSDKSFEQSTNLSFLQKKSRKGSRTRSRADSKEKKVEVPKESLFDRTKKELDELGVLNGAPELNEA